MAADDLGVRHFFSKIAGVTHLNPDGTDRQDVASCCRPSERLQLEHEEDNPADRYAVAVRRPNGQQLGYLSRDLAREVVRRSEEGFRYAVFVSQVTGGGRGRNLGVNVLVLVAEAGVTDAEAQRYVNELGIGESADRPGSSCLGVILSSAFGCLALVLCAILGCVMIVWILR